jgi:transaldolase
MKFFLDTAEIKEIRELAASGLVDGITTNPSLVLKSGRQFVDVVREICEIVPGPVSAEVISTDHETMLAEGRKLAKIASNVVVKVPLTPDGLKTCNKLSKEGTRVNVTLCFSPAQALLAAKSGTDGMQLIRDVVQIYRAYESIKTEVLVASVRHPIHIIEAAKLGADVATMPPSVLKQMFNHPLTDKGLAAFIADWAKTGQKIL